MSKVEEKSTLIFRAFNPNKAGLFEGIFFCGGGGGQFEPPTPPPPPPSASYFKKN